MQSGYHDPDGARMKNFLACWKEQAMNFRYREKSDEFTGYENNSADGDKFQGKFTPSILNFYKEAKQIGWFSAFDVEYGNRFKNIDNINKFSVAEPMDYEILKSIFGDEDPPDYRYYIYNKSQGGSSSDLYRGRDFDAMLTIGGEGQGIIYNAISNEKSLDGEYQIFYYDPHNSAIRFKSFAHLLVFLYLGEYQKLRKNNGSFGGMFGFKGDWKDTCVPLLFDMNEIESWGKRVPEDDYRAPFSS